MARVVVKDPQLGDLLPHYFERGAKTKPDRFGKREGYRCSPPGDDHNLSSSGVYYRSMDDLADHLLANPDWGVRVRRPGASPSLRYNDKFVDGTKL